MTSLSALSEGYSPLKKYFFYSMRVIEYALVFMALLLPPFFFSGIGAVPVFVIRGVGLCAFFFVLTKHLFYKRTPTFLEHKDRNIRLFFILFLPFVCYLTLQCLGGLSIVSGRTFGSLAPFMTREYLLQLLSYILIFFIFYDFFKTRGRVRIAILLLAVQICVLVASGFYHSLADLKASPYFYGIDMSDKAGYYSFFLNPNDYGEYLAFAIPLFLASSIYYFTTTETFDFNEIFIEKLFYFVTLVMATVSILHADARGAFVSEMITMALFLIFFVFSRHRFWGIVLTAALSLVMLAVVGLPSLRPERILHDLAWRVTLTKDALGIFRDFPWFGVGFGAQPFVIGYYQLHGAETFAITEPYNHHIELLSEGGLVGYALFMAPVLFYVVGSARLALQTHSRWNRIFGLSVLLALTALALISCIDDYLVTPAIAVLFIFYLAVLGRCSNDTYVNEHTMESEDTERVFFGPLRLGLWTVAFAAFLGFAYLIFTDFSANVTIQSKITDARKAERALDKLGDNAYGWHALAEFYHRRAVEDALKRGNFKPDLKAAIRAYRRAAMLTPTWSTPWFELGQAEVLNEYRERGFGHMGFAISLSPHDRDAYIHLIVLYLRMEKSTPWPDEKKLFHESALAWAQKASQLPNALTLKDHAIQQGWVTLAPADEAALTALLKEFESSKAD